MEGRIIDCPKCGNRVRIPDAQESHKHLSHVTGSPPVHAEPLKLAGTKRLWPWFAGGGSLLVVLLVALAIWFARSAYVRADQIVGSWVRIDKPKPEPGAAELALYEFKADGEFESEFEAGKGFPILVFNGTYQVKSNKLLLKGSGGDEATFAVKIAGDELVLTSRGGKELRFKRKR